MIKGNQNDNTELIDDIITDNYTEDTEEETISANESDAIVPDSLTENEIFSDEEKEKIKKDLSMQWEKLGIWNDFIFCKVMSDKKLLLHLIHLIIPDLRIQDLQIEPQKTVEQSVPNFCGFLGFDYCRSPK